ncbi:MAG TPA: TerC/Alx family metal homeostasis membrane protein [Candidatus Acidoferrales bacterium]
MSETTSLLWLVLAVVAAGAITVDVLLHRRGKLSASPRAALLETCAWVALALLFDLWVLHVKGRQSSIEFLTGYLIEKSLSIDNIFLFLVIFRAFRIVPGSQHRILYYGVIGALALRVAFVFAGVALLNRFQPITYVFGAILFVTAARMLVPRSEQSAQPPWIVRLAGRVLPVTEKDDSKHFFVRENGRLLVTSLFLALVAIETMDVIFATDSIPAVLSITRDPFIAYSSNVFAVLGLRAIYFVLAGILKKVRFLHQGLAAVLVFTGLKMVLGHHFEVSDVLSLAIIGAIFAVTALASLCWPKRERA